MYVCMYTNMSSDQMVFVALTDPFPVQIILPFIAAVRNDAASVGLLLTHPASRMNHSRYSLLKKVYQVRLQRTM